MFLVKSLEVSPQTGHSLSLGVHMQNSRDMESTGGIAEIFDETSRDLGRVLCIITGASRGYGRVLALQVSSLVRPGSTLLLVARSEEHLREVQKEIQESEAGVTGLAVHCVRADLSKKEGVEHTVRMAKEAGNLAFDHLLLLNNAGEVAEILK